VAGWTAGHPRGGWRGGRSAARWAQPSEIVAAGRGTGERAPPPPAVYLGRAYGLRILRGAVQAAVLQSSEGGVLMPPPPAGWAVNAE
jgi:hypothetical protein